ncbi:MAG: acyl-CoA dehydrogenase [Actinomycetia bacterium]|nr:acyl-CoA dehydrogenase [Actinomycetes bacterium]
MSDYKAPLRDIQFALEHIVGLPELAQIDEFAHSDPEMVAGILEENGRFMADLVAPLNAVGDQAGSVRNDDGSITTPPGFAAAYQRYVEAGWGGVPFAEAHGGGGFPWLVGVAMQEIMCSANMAFSLCPLLTQGAIDALLHHGSEEQQEVYLRRMINGEWSGTMNLTEPDAGSDVGALRARAVPADDGSYRITGTKIFITYGDHDMAENIIHLVLARTPDAPPGTKGISLFIVPKFILDADNKPGERNDVEVVSIEHKLGIHGSPTCVLSFGEKDDGAVGYLIGEENAGMRYMFTMMNNARLSVGLQGLALSERAYQDALEYAQERRQGRALGAPKGESSAIIDHADVRRMLMTQRAYIEAMRALCYLNAAAIDLSRVHPEEAERASSDELAELLTPLSKGWCSDIGNEMTSLAVQVHGGMGYVEETGVAQHFRDVRIAAIYEGTNGIQAADLVGRKLPMRGGGVVTDHIARRRALDSELAEHAELTSIRDGLTIAVDQFEAATRWVMDHGVEDPRNALAGSSPYLRLTGQVTAGWLMARQALAATGLLADNPDDEFLRAKVVTARFFVEQLLPQVSGLVPAITAGYEDLFSLSPSALAG